MSEFSLYAMAELIQAHRFMRPSNAEVPSYA